MSTMYKLTRQETALELNISTRSVDRYIKAGKLRSKKDGKIVYINSNDIDNLLGKSSKKQEVIIEKPKNSNPSNNKTIVKNDDYTNQTLNLIYKDLKNEINKKDDIIRELSIKIGRTEEIAKNSISLMEHKKSQYLIEESKTHLSKEIKDLEEEKETLKEKLKYEKNSNIILIIAVIILLIIASIIWFIKI